MKPKIKQKWVTALRSGIYQQGRDCLYSGGSYCCLGVLCSLYLQETQAKLSVDDLRDNDATGNFLELPNETVTEWAGLNQQDPKLKIIDDEGNEDVWRVSQLNDNGNSFKVIADLIEKQL